MSTQISVLLPARARPANLRTSIDSLFDLARTPDAVEVLVRLDSCDPCLREELAILQARKGAVFVGVGPRLGYANMHVYYDQLAIDAGGEWIFVWNDDTDMLTSHWDELLCDCPLYSIQWPRRDTIPTAKPYESYDGPLYTDYTFPVLGRPVLEALGGHLSDNPYCDAWLSDVSGFAGTSIVRPDIVFHHHRLNDATLLDQRVAHDAWKEFFKSAERGSRIAAVHKIMQHPNWLARFHGWNVESFELAKANAGSLLDRPATSHRLLK